MVHSEKDKCHKLKIRAVYPNIEFADEFVNTISLTFSHHSLVFILLVFIFVRVRVRACVCVCVCVCQTYQPPGQEVNRDWTAVAVDTTTSFGTMRTIMAVMMERIELEMEKLTSIGKH